MRCGRKACYSIKEAIRLTRVRNIQNMRAGNYYECGKCGWWHLARQSLEDYTEDRRFSKEFRAKLGLPERPRATPKPPEGLPKGKIEKA